MHPPPVLPLVVLLGLSPAFGESPSAPAAPPAGEAAVAAEAEPRSMEEVVAAADAVLRQADEAYVAGLRAVYEQVRQAGDLEGVLAVENEIKRFELMGQLDEAQFSPSPAALRQYQQESLPKLEDAVTARHRAVLSGARRLDAALQAEVRQLLRQNRLADAGRIDEQRKAIAAHPACVAAAAYVPPARAAAPGRTERGPAPEEEIDESIFLNLRSTSAGYLWKFEEGTGPVTLDANARFPLELRAPAGFGEGHAGKGLAGRGPYASARLRDDAVPRNFPGQRGDGPRDFTLAAWVFIEKIDFALGIIHRTTASGRSFKLEVGADMIPEFTVYTGAEKSELRGPRPIEAGKWHHLAVSYEYKSRNHCPARLYVDGNLTATRMDFNGPPNAVDDAVHVGQTLAREFSPRASMKWILDDLGVYPRALNGVEIKALAK